MPSAPEITFYILASDNLQQRLEFVCKLTEKIYRNSGKVFICTDSGQINQTLDDLLWTFRAGSFIPHAIMQSTEQSQTNPVLIADHWPPQNWAQNVINLSDTVPENTGEIQRIIEIIDNDEQQKQKGRLRYKHYQQLELAITTHKL